MRACIKNNKIVIFILFLAYLCPFFVSANDLHINETDSKVLDLRKQIEELTKQSEKLKKDIKDKKQQGDTLTRQISIIDSQVKNLQNEIQITEYEIIKKNKDIKNTQNDIKSISAKLEAQKKIVLNLVIKMYRYDKKPIMATLFQGSQLSDIFNDLESYELVTDQLNDLILDIKVQKNELEKNENDLLEEKNELENLNQQQVSKKISLDETKQDKSVLLKKTKGLESEYQKILSEVELKKEKFFQELKEYERLALSNGSVILHITAKNVPPPGTKLFSWPEKDFVHTQDYGMTKYAKRGAYGGAPHNGVDIASGKGSAIYSIGRGVILATGFNSGFGNWVAVRHENDMVSLYAHLVRPSGLTNGTGVDNNSIIGYEGSTGNSTGSHLHLSLYRDFFTYIKNNQLYFNYFDGSVDPSDYIQ